MNIEMCVYFQISIFVFLEKYPEVELLDITIVQTMRLKWSVVQDFRKMSSKRGANNVQQFGNKLDRKGQILYVFTYMWNLFFYVESKKKKKKKREEKNNKYSKEKQTHRYREQTGTYQKEEEWERGKIDEGN